MLICHEIKELIFMSFWEALRISASGLTAQQMRMDVISNNIANAQTTRTAEGGPYKRQDVVFTTEGTETFSPALISAMNKDGSQNLGGVRVAEIVTDNSEGSKVYDPTNPDANTDGYVLYPNVDPVVETTNMLSATRSYEANLAAVDAAKTMALKALDIAR
jgi:flagellar basal-body rod protein FlgC